MSEEKYKENSREQTPKAQIILFGQSLGPVHWSTGEQPRVGSPVNPS